MIDNNILQSLGAGSGIDTPNLISQLVSIERTAPQQRIDSKRDLAETRISDFGTLTSTLSTLQDAAAALIEPEALFSKSASFTESDALVPTELGTDVQAGTYAFEVAQIATAHTLAYAGVSDVDAAIGEGTLTFSFGAWARTADVISGAFTQDTDTDDVTITIDSTNNSLEGLRDAINDADFGASASIIFDGTDFRLTIVAESGEDNQLEITANESGGAGLSDYAFTTGAEIDGAGDPIDRQGGQNAELTLNGVTIERSSNTIDDIVEGLTLDILKPTDVGEIVSVTVADDKAFAEQNIRNFVEAYNLFLEAIDPIFGVNEVEDEEGETETVVGSLANDGLAKSILTQIRTTISSAIPGLADSDLTSLTNVGIRTEIDGSLSIDEDDFTEAFESYFEDVQKLFSPHTITSDNDITINSFSDNTTAGEYDIVVTQAPVKGYYDLGNAIVNLPGTDLVIAGGTHTFQFDVNGTQTEELTLPDGTYTTTDELVAAVQTLINGDVNLTEATETVTVSYNSGTGALDFDSKRYGAASIVSIVAASTDSLNDLGFVEGTGTAGATAAGTVNGEAAFGSANVLLPALGDPGEGLAMVIGENAVSATVNFSRGFAGELNALIESFLATDGVIATRTETLGNNIDALEEDETALDRRMTSYEERLLNQFIAMERIISSLSSSGSFLDNLINTLPFTSGNNR
ncbi:MAG: flagellar hook-associated protein 2 [Flavobacteriales bacterium]|jgi:flagellar hook-associated protein 2